MDSTPTPSKVNPRAEAGRKGGLKVLEKYGREHFRTIGRRGYLTTLNRHWQGDTVGYRAWLIRKGWDAVADDLAERELDRQLRAGAVIASVELPVMSDFDDDPADLERRAGEAEAQSFLEAGIPLW